MNSERTKLKRSIGDVLGEHSDSLMATSGVAGVAEGEFDGKPCILVLVVELTNELRKQIPNDLDGYRVVVSESGEIKAL